MMHLAMHAFAIDKLSTRFSILPFVKAITNCMHTPTNPILSFQNSYLPTGLLQFISGR